MSGYSFYREPGAQAPRQRDYIIIQPSPPTIASVQAAVARAFDVPLFEMRSQRRSRTVARPRQVAMFLCSRVTSGSLSMIGRHFGGRDHTTVMHGIRAVEKARAEDSDFDAKVRELEARL